MANHTNSRPADGAAVSPSNIIPGTQNRRTVTRAQVQNGTITAAPQPPPAAPAARAPAPFTPANGWSFGGQSALRISNLGVRRLDGSENELDPDRELPRPECRGTMGPAKTALFAYDTQRGDWCYHLWTEGMRGDTRATCRVQQGSTAYVAICAGCDTKVCRVSLFPIIFPRYRSSLLTLCWCHLELHLRRLLVFRAEGQAAVQRR